VWGLINGLQVFVHLPTLGVLFPDPSQDLVDKIVEIANLDLIPNLNVFYSNHLKVPEEDEDAMSQVFVDTGYESKFFVKNAGSLYVFMLVLLVFLACLPAFTLCTRLCTCFNRPLNWLKGRLMFNPIIRILLEATLDFGFSIFIQRTTLEDSEVKEETLFTTINTISLWFCLVLFSILPIAIATFLCCNFEKLHTEEYMKKYGALYLGLDVRYRSSLVYPI
jgi:hypothetical protein